MSWEARARALLGRIQWDGVSDTAAPGDLAAGCPCCGAAFQDGHLRDCELGALLAPGSLGEIVDHAVLLALGQRADDLDDARDQHTQLLEAAGRQLDRVKVRLDDLERTGAETAADQDRLARDTQAASDETLEAVRGLRRDVDGALTDLRAWLRTVDHQVQGLLRREQ